MASDETVLDFELGESFDLPELAVEEALGAALDLLCPPLPAAVPSEETVK